MNKGLSLAVGVLVFLAAGVTALSLFQNGSFSGSALTAEVGAAFSRTEEMKMPNPEAIYRKALQKLQQAHMTLRKEESARMSDMQGKMRETNSTQRSLFTEGQTKAKQMYQQELMNAKTDEEKRAAEAHFKTAMQYVEHAYKEQSATGGQSLPATAKTDADATLQKQKGEFESKKKLIDAAYAAYKAKVAALTRDFIHELENIVGPLEQSEDNVRLPRKDARKDAPKDDSAIPPVGTVN